MTAASPGRVGVSVRGSVPLAPRTTIGVGGPARFLVEAEDLESLQASLELAARERWAVELLGGGSNLLVADAGVEALVIAVALRGVKIVRAGSQVLVTAAAGEVWDDVVARTVAEGLSGLECLSGIPGSVGATPVQNVGAYGREVGELVTRVWVLDRRDLTTRELGAQDCDFSYRASVFKREGHGRYVVLAVTYRLEHGAPPVVRYAELARYLDERGLAAPTVGEVRDAVLAVRRTKSMVRDPGDPNARSCGSFFVNPVVSTEQAAAVAARSLGGPPPQYPQSDGRVKLAAAWLIGQAGFARGMHDGNVGLSDHHTLAIVARPGATATEVVRFAWRVRRAVRERFGVRLEPEPVPWGFARLDGGLPVVGDDTGW
ncbi:MAG: UDP-N-acetylmuramate dehydrogenase [Polyangiaceae bacterium]|nr:UDP-N-acetylmuramate dehydrogenase [Polyangiaceae bacterium]